MQDMWQLWLWVEEKHDGSWAQAARVYDINNCVVLGDCYRGFTVAAGAVWVLSGIPRSSGYGPGQEVVVARPGCVTHSAAGTSCRCLCSGRDWLPILM